jgi:hypothetical protein
MTDAETNTEDHDAKSGDAAPAPARRMPRKLALIGAGAAVVLIVAVAAALRPASHDAPEPAHEEAAAETAAPVSPEMFGDDLLPAHALSESEGACSRPSSATGIAAVVAADAAYDAGDFARARELYLDLLLGGAGLGDEGDAVMRWAHGRLALSMARLARAPRSALLDEPALDFPEEPR